MCSCSHSYGLGSIQVGVQQPATNGKRKRHGMSVVVINFVPEKLYCTKRVSLAKPPSQHGIPLAALRLPSMQSFPLPGRLAAVMAHDNIPVVRVESLAQHNSSFSVNSSLYNALVHDFLGGIGDRAKAVDGLGVFVLKVQNHGTLACHSCG